VGERFSGLLRNAGRFGRITAGEYQANLNGLNMLFGAVLGFVLAGTEKLNSLQFGFVLTMLASVVIAICTISSGRYRILYSVLALVGAIFFPEMIDLALQGKNLVPDKIRPTLIVWTLLTIVVEFWSRGNENEPQT
jgi:hypothetical protein